MMLQSKAPRTRLRLWIAGTHLFAISALACLTVTGLSRNPSFRRVSVSNTEPRRDNHGDIIDAHDGCLHFFAGRYYLYGTAYGKSSGYGLNNRFRVYSSPDLEHWTFDGELLKAPPDGVYYRPYVAYNPRTSKYVLWYNWYPKLWEGKVGVAVSDSPVGPFTIVTTAALLSGADKQPGDGSLFVDNDGTGYFIYTAIAENHAIRVERLAPDFLGSTGETGDVLGEGSEAPSMFHFGDRYYALFDRTCCFCSAGSGVRVLVASAPLGPYREQMNINVQPDGRPTVAAQQTFVAELPTPSGTAYLWMGDRWNSRPDGIKGNDFQYWTPLEFRPDGSLAPIQNTATWSLRVEVGNQRAPLKQPYVWPKRPDAHTPEKDPCTGALLSSED